ncbi:MBL fold metallo-hydrolase [Terrimonas alba]|uniref:MBL fold metallo-hydrolase n=1 Tax=Terrimonas alba TaxID=3349636 RepID=UPI0035F42B0D
MKNKEMKIDAETLRIWLEEKKPVFVLDIRPKEQREEWQIPDSHYLDAYKRLNEGDKSVLDEIGIPDNSKVVTVCAAGRTSQIASDALREKGIDAYSLQGGMKAWSGAWNVAQKQFSDFEVLQVRRTGKGCLSYIIFSNNEAIIIDASIPPQIYEQLINQYKLSVRYVIETHIHADHLSRSKQVADLFKVPLFLPGPNKVQFPHNPIIEDTRFKIGAVTLKPLHTPGHTLESYSFYIENVIVITGDTLFTNGVGRPDLKASIEESRIKAGLLYHSLRKLLSLPDNVLILPAHINKPVDFDGVMISTTIGEAKKNIALLSSSENDFINGLLQKIPPTPANYLSIVEKNLAGEFSNNESFELEAGANRCAVS